jgi:hypothetical protein
VPDYVVDTRFPPDAPAIARCSVCDTLTAMPAGKADRWCHAHYSDTGHPTEWVLA